MRTPADWRGVDGRPSLPPSPQYFLGQILSSQRRVANSRLARFPYRTTRTTDAFWTNHITPPPPDCLHGHLPGPFLLFWVTRFCFFLVCLIFSFLFSALDWPANLVSVWAHLNYTVSYRIRHQRPETKLLLSERAISDDRRSSFSHPTGNCGVDNGREILHDSQRLRETDSRAVHAHRHTNNFN